MSKEHTPPTFAVTRGTATPEEIAALAAVLSLANAAATANAPARSTSGWARPGRRLVRSMPLGVSWGGR